MAERPIPTTRQVSSRGPPPQLLRDSGQPPTGAESNFGKISSPEIDADVEQILDELDPDKARALANDLDKRIFGEVFSLPLFQSAGNVGVRSNLANFGPAGLGDLNYSAIGFMK